MKMKDIIENANVKNPTHVFIVGAGFSMHAGLPLQMDFTAKLLEARKGNSHSQKQLIKYLADFVHDTFDHNVKARADFWPELEDIFTSIDLAANSGHHLSKNYDPAKLRSIRRMLLSRILYMLDECCDAGKGQDNEERLKNFFLELPEDRYAFISMNWDTVIERNIIEHKNISSFNYKCKAIPAEFSLTGTQIKKRTATSEKVTIVKMHGSANWLYCDNCRKLFWFAPDKGKDVAMQILTGQQAIKLELQGAEDEQCGKWECSDCKEVKLTTRIATFSYLKALDFPMFQRSWLAAEDLLRNAKKWIFIGYSLPAADYEFKYLLKRVQLARLEPPEFVVITGKKPSENNKNSTYANYQRFFGRKIKEYENVFYDGLSKKAIEASVS